MQTTDGEAMSMEAQLRVRRDKIDILVLMPKAPPALALLALLPHLEVLMRPPPPPLMAPPLSLTSALQVQLHNASAVCTLLARMGL